MSHALYFDELPSGIFSRYVFTFYIEQRSIFMKYFPIFALSLIAMCTLDLSDNQISDIPMDTFHKMPKLIHLYLQVQINIFIFDIPRREIWDKNGI